MLLVSLMHSEWPENVLIDSHWDILLLRNNTVFFDNIYGINIRLNRLNRPLEYFIQQIKCRSDLPIILKEIKERFGEVEAGSAYNLARELLIRGILKVPLAHDIDQELLARFKSQIAWLDGYGPNAGLDGFLKLRRSTVALIGLGGAGSLCAMMLASAGIGRLKLIDGDHVAETNLVRQMFYTEQDAIDERTKVSSLSEKIGKFSKHTEVEEHTYFVTDDETALSAVAGADLVIQTADRPRIVLNRILNRACCRNRTPYIYSFVDQIGPMYVADHSACFNCLEADWRDELGPEHDMIVEALQSLPPRDHPSVVSGATQIADALFYEAIGLLSGAYKPKTLNARLRPSEHTILTCRRRTNCRICGMRRRKP